MNKQRGKRRRLLYYNDSRHSYMYSYDPPMSLDAARAPVDEIAGTSVGVFVYGSGAGPAMMHDTKVGEVWGRRFREFNSAWSWRAYENVKSLIEAGYDPLDILIDRAREKGLEFFASLRLNHPMDPADVDNPFNWPFRIDHPEYCLTGGGRHAFNWEREEVRAERFAYVEEYLTSYDVDGLELEFTFCPWYFEDGEGERNANIITDFLRQTRALADRVAAERGRPVEIGAKVLPTRRGNLTQGLDVASWLQEGLLDFVVPTIYEDRQVDPNFPFEWLSELAAGSACSVYPTLQRGARGLDASDDRVVPSALDRHADLDELRAAAASYWERGADGVYLLFLKWPHGPEQRAFFTEAHDPDLLRRSTKRYVLRRGEDSAARFDYGAQLKATLEPGGGAHDVDVYVADDLDGADTTLRMRMTFSSALDTLRIRVNDAEIPLDGAIRTELDAYLAAWIELEAPQGILKRGWNTLSLELEARPTGLGGEIVWESAEVVVRHPAPQASSDMP